MAESATSRTMRTLRKEGYVCAVVEHWNAHVKIRQDLFGFIDVIAIKPGITIGVQCTSMTNLSHRRDKIKAEPRARMWLAAGNTIELWGWAKRKNRWLYKRERLPF